MNVASTGKIYFLSFLAFVCLVLLFFGGPDYYSSRSFKSGWQFGHIITFSIWTYLFLYFNVEYTKRIKNLFFLLLIGTCLGGAIELIQILFDRDPSFNDIVLDIEGMLIIILLKNRNRFFNIKKIQCYSKNLIVLILFIQFIPFFMALTDEALALKQFPVLSDFETPFEKQRWGSSQIEVTDKESRAGKKSLLVHLKTTQYSGVGLKYFPQNWEGYYALCFSVLNPEKEPLKLKCRVNDAFHNKHGHRSEDRFAKSFTILNGWNDICIPLKEIENAPTNREMELDQIKGLGFYTVKLNKAQRIYIDHIKLK